MGKSYVLFYDSAYQYCRKRFQQEGLTFNICPNEANVLFLMLSTPGIDTAKEISAELSMAPALVSRVVDGLVRKGYVTTQRDTLDRRMYHILLNNAQSVSMDRIRAFCYEFTTLLTQDLSKEEICTFFRVFHKMKDNIRKEK